MTRRSPCFIRSAPPVRSVFAPVTALALVTALASSAHASPMQLFGFGATSPGLAGTGVASPAGFEAVYLNPAGLADIRDKFLGVGGMAGDFSLTGADRPVDDALGLEAGLALRIPFGGWLKHRVGFAAGVYLPPRVVTQIRAPRTGTPYFTLLESRAQTTGIHAALGARINHRWSVGAGVLVQGALRGTIDVVTDTAGRFSAVTETSLVTDIAPVLGARWRATSRLRTGLTVRFASSSAYRIDVAADFGDDIPVALPAIALAGVAQYDPLTVAAELSLALRDRITVNGQLAWERWSGFPSPSENPIDNGDAIPRPGFHDTVVPRVAVEWRPRVWRDALAVRGGYFFALSPAPEQTAEISLLDNHRHVASLGLGVQLSRRVPVRIDAWMQVHALMSRRHDRPDSVPDVETSGAIVIGGAVVGVELQ